MAIIKVLAKGQVVIPASMRKKFGIQPGAELNIFEYGNLIYLVPPSQNAIKDAMGCLPSNPSLPEELLKERQKDFSQ
jgi:AbrB family looped-hinge helix DNA binding protein